MTRQDVLVEAAGVLYLKPTSGSLPIDIAAGFRGRVVAPQPTCRGRAIDKGIYS
jgi:hypothetical protein